MSDIYMQTSSDTEQLATVREVKNVVRSSLGGRLIATTHGRISGNKDTTVSIRVPDNTDYVIIKPISFKSDFTTDNGTSNASGVHTGLINSEIIVFNNGSGLLPSLIICYGSLRYADNRNSSTDIRDIPNKTIAAVIYLNSPTLSFKMTDSASYRNPYVNIEAYSFT